MKKIKHGQSKRGQRTSEYQIWRGMKTRCQNSKSYAYKYYGGRGIQVCKRWQDFRNFFTDMGKRPGPEYSIDRIDNDGNYEPGNCRWATPHEQRVNSRPRSHGVMKQRWFRSISPQGKIVESNNQSEIARIFNLDRGAISNCLRGYFVQHKGWQFQWI